MTGSGSAWLWPKPSRHGGTARTAKGSAEDWFAFVGGRVCAAALST
jgi:hypothetical protein